MEVGTCDPKMKRRATVIDSREIWSRNEEIFTFKVHLRATIIHTNVTCVEKNTTSTQNGGF